MTFHPTYIYIKECNHCGLKYLGKSCLKTEKEVHKYKGSGTYWTNHLKKHNHTINSVIINYFTKSEKDYCVEFCLKTSSFFDIAKSKKWANLKYEDGIDSGMTGMIHSEESKQKMSNSHKGKKISEETKQKLSKALKGKMSGKKHPMYGKKASTETKLKMSNAGKARKGIPQKKVKCPHCGLVGGKTGMIRFHFNNCKTLKGKTNEKNVSDETRKKISDTKKGFPQKKVKCPHCSKVGGISGMTRCHFDNCKKGFPQKKVKCPHCGLVGGKRGMKRYHFDNCKTLKK